MKTYFIITIDTEEDEWSEYKRSGCTLDNIKAIPELQALFDKYDAKPTYLTTYQVANNEESVKILKEVVFGERGEIGAHCHPWNTPPFKEELSQHNSMLCNLAPSLQLEKLAKLTEKIEQSFGKRPLSFRAGRWGYSADVAKCLAKLGYRTETSLTPFMNWEVYSGPDLANSPTRPYFFAAERPLLPASEGDLLEVPVSIGFNLRDFDLWHCYQEIFSKHKIMKKIFCGSLSRLGILRKIWLSPELSTSTEMIKLIEIMKTKKHNVFNLMFHSNSLSPGKTPFVKSNSDKKVFLNKIEDILRYGVKSDFEFTTLNNFKNNFESL